MRTTVGFPSLSVVHVDTVTVPDPSSRLSMALSTRFSTILRSTTASPITVGFSSSNAILSSAPPGRRAAATTCRTTVFTSHGWRSSLG